MRWDKEGKLHTLEEDIENIWKQHGLSLIEEVVRSDDTERGIIVWIIKATLAKNITPRVSS